MQLSLGCKMKNWRPLHSSGNGALENLLILSCVCLFVIPDDYLYYYNYDYYYTANTVLLRLDYQYIIY